MASLQGEWTHDHGLKHDENLETADPAPWQHGPQAQGQAVPAFDGLGRRPVCGAGRARQTGSQEVSCDATACTYVFGQDMLFEAGETTLKPGKPPELILVSAMH